MRGGWPLPLRLYGLATGVLLRAAYRRAARRLAEGGVPEERQRERLGYATVPRPEGRLVWFHAASVGESLSVLPLVERVVGHAQVLVTTGTAASAERGGAAGGGRVPRRYHGGDGAVVPALPGGVPGRVAGAGGRA